MRYKFFFYLVPVCFLISSYASAQLFDALPRQAYWGASFLPPSELRSGSTVRRIVPAGFAEKTGLQVGDVVLKVNDLPIGSNRDYQHVFRSTQFVRGGAEVKLEVLRNDDIFIMQGTLPAMPLESFEGIITEYHSVLSPKGYEVQVIINRPANKTGKLPGILFVRWMSCDPIEKPVSPKHGSARLLEDLILKSGYAVMRVEKPGLGDSEGPLCYDADFRHELAAHKAALHAFKQLDFIDTSKLIIVGNSNGAAYAPLVGEGENIAAYVVSGGWTKTWFEHDLEFKRRLYALQGNTPEEITRKLKLVTEFNTEYLIRKKLPADIFIEKPHLTEIWDDEPDHQYDLPVTYMQQLQDLNIASAWSKVNVPVYVFYGEYDFLMSSEDHEQIANLVNTNKPGLATYELIPKMNHSLFWFDNMQDSFSDFWGKGVYKDELSDKVITWMKNVIQ